MRNIFITCLIIFTLSGVILAADAPRPYGPVPTECQLHWHELGQYAFVHFGMNTFTNKEAVYGDEDPKLFNPTSFDANQIVAAVKAGGLKGLVFTAKHGGFCLWPTKSTPYNISASPYKNGKGDIVKEMSDACKNAGLKFGVYTTFWDCNNPEFARPAYLPIFHQQLRELLTNYGPLFEVWFDGAGVYPSTAYYGGAKDTRGVQFGDYGMKEVCKMFTQLQPGCIPIGCCLYDLGGIILAPPQGGAIWGGSEGGYVGDPYWSTCDGKIDIRKFPFGTGARHGNIWLPGEADVSIRPGWFWHASQNGSVKSPEALMNIYLSSVGRGANSIVNIPPDRRGLVYENDVASLKEYGEHLRQTFAENLAQGAKPTASNVRGNDPLYGPQKLLDDDMWSAWVVDDDVKTPEVVLELNGEKTFNMIRLREDIRLGQRIEGVAVDASANGAWKEIAHAQSIGALRLWRVPTTTTTKVRIRVTKAAVCPALSDFGLFLEPKFAPWLPPIGTARQPG